jgi:hypothetical protein
VTREINAAEGEKLQTYSHIDCLFVHRNQKLLTFNKNMHIYKTAKDREDLENSNEQEGNTRMNHQAVCSSGRLKP